jgi:hypothetical protein
MPDEQSTMPPTITRDSIAAEVGKGAIPEGYVPFRGYLAAGEAGTCRIFVDDQFVRWLVVSTNDIVGRRDIQANAQDPRDLIWVRRGARIAQCEVRSAHEIANDGCGVDTNRMDGAEPTDPSGPPPPY